MAYADDAVRAKLSALNETQDSIVSVAQWIIFHRRHADRTAELWMERLKDANPPKKLNLIYLANEVVQQSKARKKDDFFLAFSPIIAEATSLAYKSATQETGQKIKRVVEVWRQRNIFELPIQDATEKRLQEVDKSRTARSGGARLGGSLFSTPTLPPELQPLEKPQSALSRLESTSRPLLDTANTEFTKLTDPNTPLPSPPVYAARLSSLLKNLASAEGAVNDSIKARNELIAGLEKLLESNKAKLSEEGTASVDLSSRRAAIETKKKEVEDAIMRGLSADNSTVNTPTMTQPQATDGSPEVESFTPPPPDVENFTPTGSPEPAYPADERDYQQDFLESSTYAADPIQEQEPRHEGPPPAFEPPPALQTAPSAFPDGASMLLNSLTRPAPDTASTNGASGDPRLKRRKMNHTPDMDEDIFGKGEGVGLDQDVAAMLGAQ